MPRARCPRPVMLVSSNVSFAPDVELGLQADAPLGSDSGRDGGFGPGGGVGAAFGAVRAAGWAHPHQVSALGRAGARHGALGRASRSVDGPTVPVRTTRRGNQLVPARGAPPPRPVHLTHRTSVRTPTALEVGPDEPCRAQIWGPGGRVAGGAVWALTRIPAIAPRRRQDVRDGDPARVHGQGLIDPTLRTLRAESAQLLLGLCRHLLVELITSSEGDPGLDPDLEAERLHAVLDGVGLHAVSRPEQVTPDVMRAVIGARLTSLRRR